MGHIEDIVVNKDQQGKKLGLRIIEALDFIAEKVGCYKVRSSVLFSASRAMACTPSLSRGCEPLRALHTTDCWTCIVWIQFLTFSFPLYAGVRHPTPPTTSPTTPTPHPTLSPSLILTTQTLCQSSQADILLPRQFSTAPKRMKASTSNAAIRGSDWRWHTIMINDYNPPAQGEGRSETCGRG